MLKYIINKFTVDISCDNKILINRNENINKNKKIKCFLQQTDKGDNIWDEINEDEYYELINTDLKEKISRSQIDYNKQNDMLLNDIDMFNSHLIKLLNISQRQQRFVPQKQMQIIKYSNLNAKFISWVLGQKLIILLKKLIIIGKSFTNTKTSLILDLIQFKVTDLMRSMISGNKKQILAVYQNLLKLQKQGIIKIIKIKNRLTTSLNDVLIVFSLKDTFLLCQTQLIISNAVQIINQKHKHIQTLNHFFYQLQRSPYGILSEVAVLLAYKDSKISYQDNITFQINQINIQKCSKIHPNSILQIKKQNKPFICTKCNKYYFKYQNVFLMKNCQICNLFVCAKCIFSKDQQLEQSMINQQINSQIQKAIAKIYKKQIKFSSLSKIQHVSSLQKSQSISTLTKSASVSSLSGRAPVILQIFEKPFQKIQQLFGKQIQISKLKQYLSKKQPNIENELYFIMVQFRSDYVVLKELIYNCITNQIRNPFDIKQKFIGKKKLHCGSYDLILFYSKQGIKSNKKQQILDIQDNMVHLFISEQELIKMIRQKQGMGISVLNIKSFRLVINVQKQIKKEYIKRDQIIKLDDLDQTRIKCSKQFTYNSLHQFTKGYSNIALAKNIIQLSDIGIMNKHIKFFKQINWVLDIKQLNISKNKLQNIDIVLAYCVQLERLYINQNYIKQLNFNKKLSSIQIINATDNQITSISGLNKIKNISKLLLNKNQFNLFPSCQLPNLKILNLQQNPIHDYHNIYTSTFPSLQQLFLNSQQINQTLINQKNNSRNNSKISTSSKGKKSKVLNKTVLGFQTLRSFQSDNKVSQLIIRSKQIQRINLCNNQLRRIQLLAFQNLKYLIITSNEIDNLDFMFNNKNNFQNNVICQIDFKYNKLITLPTIKSSSLIKANFSYNSIIQINCLSNSQIPCLTQMNLQHNKITSISIINLPKLQKLGLTNNPITNITQLQNSNLQSLFVLDLSQCSNINYLPCLYLNKLKQIWINNTTIQSMQSLSNSHLPNINILTIKKCTIKNFPILNLSTLQTLDLSNSCITNLVNLQKSNLQNLKSLLLQNVTVDSTQQQEKEFKWKFWLGQKQTFSCKLRFPCLQRLNVSGLKLKNMSGLQQSRLPKMEQIIMNQCIAQIYPRLQFRCIKRIIASRCEIKQIDRVITQRLQNLQQIDMSQNMIQEVNIQLPRIKIINLNKNKITIFNQKCTFKQLIQLRLDNNKLIVFPLIKANSLKIIQMTNNPFQDISKLQSCLFNSLETFKLNYSSLEKCPLPILSFPSLKTLQISCSSLINISNLQFSNLPEIQNIYFYQNKIINIPIFKFSSLKVLWLHINQIINIDNLSISQCQQLTTIYLTKNKIKTIPLLPFPNLTNFYIQANCLQNISQFNNSQIKYIKQIDISKNQNLTQPPKLKCPVQILNASNTNLYDSIKIQQYKGLTKIILNSNKIKYLPRLNQRQLQAIKLTDNLLTNIDQFAQQEYPFCIQLALTDNKIKKIPLLKMKKLNGAWFNNNLIQNIDQFLNSDLPQLQMLSFQQNKLKKIKKLPFPNLFDLYLTKNTQLKQLSCFNLPQYPKIRIIVCFNSGIQKVQVLPKMPILQSIWLNISKLRDLDWLSKSMCNIPRLKFLNVSNNKITSICCLKDGNLSSLYVKQNPIQDINKLLSMQRVYFDRFVNLQISIKTKNDEEYERKSEKLRGLCPKIVIQRFK